MSGPVIDPKPGGKIVPFDAKKHAGLGLSQSSLSHFMATRNAFAISLTEFFYASQHYPVVFVKAPDESLQASVLTGLRQSENLFIDAEGNWQEQAYVPAYVRRFPFYTVDSEDGAQPDKALIMVDETGLEVSQHPFIESSGEASKQWLQMKRFIADYIAANKLTLEFTAKMERLDLLEAFEAQINPKLQSRMQVSGMYRIDENKLNRLPARVIKDLMQKGELSRIYAHLISLENFAKLLDLSAASDQSDLNKT